MEQYIVIAGNIGAGKSTLVEQVCRKTLWKPSYEPVSENPYLADFYKDMKSWSLHSQLFFMVERIEAFKRYNSFQGVVVQDRSVYEDAEIFAKSLYLQGLLNNRDYMTYLRLYTLYKEFIQPPDLVVYVKADVELLRRRILHRGRAIEKNITRDYLESLNLLYEEWISCYTLSPVVIVEASKVDVLTNQMDLEEIVALIKEKAKNKQGLLFE